MSKAKFEDLTGEVYNGLTAVRMIRWEAGKGFIWLFRCVCGKEKELRQVHAISGHTKSCGCLRKSTKKNFPQPCKKCGEITDRKTSQGGYSKICQKCYNGIKNHSSGDLAEYMWRRAKDRANKHGLPFSITKEDVVVPTHCPILGVELKRSTSLADRSGAPSIDKIIPGLGYVVGNIAVISHRANLIKNNGTADEHRRIADWIDAQTEAA